MEVVVHLGVCGGVFACVSVHNNPTKAGWIKTTLEVTNRGSKGLSNCPKSLKQMTSYRSSGTWTISCVYSYLINQSDFSIIRNNCLIWSSVAKTQSRPVIFPALQLSLDRNWGLGLPREKVAAGSTKSVTICPWVKLRNTPPMCLSELKRWPPSAIKQESSIALGGTRFEIGFQNSGFCLKSLC